MATMNISLPDRMKQWVERQAAGGRYANASDYIRDLIRRDQLRVEAVETLQMVVDDAIAQGVSDKSLDEAIAEAKAKGRATLKARDGA